MGDSLAANKILTEHAISLRKHGRMDCDMRAELGVLVLTSNQGISALNEAGVTIESRRAQTMLGWILIVVACVVTFSLAVAFTFWLPLLAYKWVVVFIAIPPAVFVYVALVATMRALGLPTSRIVRASILSKSDIKRRLAQSK